MTQINLVVKSCFFQYRNYAKLKLIISGNDVKTVITALINLKMDYNNCLYLGISQPLKAHLQLFQNSAASIRTETECTPLTLLQN